MAAPPRKPGDETFVEGLPPVPEPSNVVVSESGLWADTTIKRTTESSRIGDSLTGLTLGEYEVHEQLGAGGMGIVYRGVQPMIGKPVAIKVLRPEIAADTSFVAELLAEARAVNAIRHPGIVDIFSFGTTPDGRQYIVMELLDGQPLDVMIAERGHLLVTETLEIMEQVLSALAAAHKANVIHRDLKPGNILVTKMADGSIRTKILDFGLAKQAPKGASSVAQTHAHVVRGTPAYMAPEQARALAVSAQTDLYAIGVIMFEMVTGKLPFTAPSLVELLMEQINKVPPTPSSLESFVPESLDDLVLRLLAKTESERPAGADEVRHAIVRIKKELQSQETRVKGFVMPSRAEPGAPSRSVPRTSAPNPAPASLKVATTQVDDPIVLPPNRAPLYAVVGLGVAALVGGAGWYFWPSPPPPPQPQPQLVPELPLIKPDAPKVDVKPVEPQVDVKPVEPPKVEDPPVEPPKVDVKPVEPPKVDVPKPDTVKPVKQDPKPKVGPTKRAVEAHLERAVSLAGDRQDQKARQARAQLDECRAALAQDLATTEEIEALINSAEKSLKEPF